MWQILNDAAQPPVSFVSPKNNSGKNDAQPPFWVIRKMTLSPATVVSLKISNGEK